MKIIGIDELVKDFAALGEDAVARLKEPSTTAGNIVLNKAVSKVSKQTGKLASTLKLSKPTQGKNKYRIVAKVGFGKGGMYGVPLELGHKMVLYGHKTNEKVEAKPFLRPAADESKEEVAAIITEAMNKILAEMGDKK